MTNPILVTGGAGYIGSHVVKQLGERGEQVFILDNLSTGFRDSVLFGELVYGDTGNQELVQQIIGDNGIDTVMHFAAHTIVPESVSDPLKYYGNNTCSTKSLLEVCARMGINNFVFSSTAAVYGEVATGVASEDTETAPINPYGRSKLMSEWMLKDLCSSSQMEAVILRYFNVAGSDPGGRIGQSTRNATLLIKVACEVALGKRDHLEVFGTDYPTPDGTGIRDYIHVNDLASAHLAALDYLRNGNQTILLNCGYGHGYSVKEVIAAVERVSGEKLNVVESPRRPGDSPRLIADAKAIRSKFGWEPSLNKIDEIVRTSLLWEQKLGAEQPGS